MGILPMVLVLQHFAQRKNNRVSETSRRVSLTRFVFEPSVQGDEYIAHGMKAHVTLLFTSSSH